MATHTTCTKGNDSAAHTELHATIHDLHASAQDQFNVINSIAKLALLAMEAQDAYKHTEILAGAFQAIWYLSEEAESSINNLAIDAGSEYEDTSKLTRVTAAMNSVTSPVRCA